MLYDSTNVSLVKVTMTQAAPKITKLSLSSVTWNNISQLPKPSTEDSFLGSWCDSTICLYSSLLFLILHYLGLLCLTAQGWSIPGPLLCTFLFPSLSRWFHQAGWLQVASTCWWLSLQFIPPTLTCWLSKHMCPKFSVISIWRSHKYLKLYITKILDSSLHLQTSLIPSHCTTNHPHNSGKTPGHIWIPLSSRFPTCNPLPNLLGSYL